MRCSPMCPVSHQPRAGEEGGTASLHLPSLQPKREGASQPVHRTYTCQGKRKVLRTGKTALKEGTTSLQSNPKENNLFSFLGSGSLPAPQNGKDEGQLVLS